MQTEAIYKLFKQSKGISTDTRSIEEGQLFFALSGPNFNANKFAQMAIDKGAIAAVVDHKDYAVNDNYILVEDCLKQLQALANYHRNQLECTIIAVCGSNGKTTSKELIARVLESTFNTFYTPGNFNNHIGVPLSLLMLKPEHEYAVIEMGANHAGEHELLCQIAEPDFGVITNNGKDHLEGFGSIEGVIKANAELFHYLEENLKTAFVNADDDILMTNSENIARICYGTSVDSDCQVSLLNTFPFTKVKLNFRSPEACEVVESQMFGSFQQHNLALAASIGNHFDVDSEKIKDALESYQPANMRTQLTQWQGNDILLDAYNANPSSVMAILNDFVKFNHRKKGVVLGDMLEMGDASFGEHKAVVEFLKQYKFSFVALVGKEFAKHQIDGFHYFEKNTDAKSWLLQNGTKDHYILIKGSRGLKLEDIIK
ncbi:MAG: UDP-N-acetylmuramoyl-tripeptide--D-alanyl-D-alanine ligase [Bacteroidia bacterium]